MGVPPKLFPLPHTRSATKLGAMKVEAPCLDVPSGLSDAGFDEVAADARQMADALNDLADALDALGDASPEEAFTDLMRDQGNAIGRMPIDELAAALGNCS
jgi:hypothetical protein